MIHDHSLQWPKLNQDEGYTLKGWEESEKGLGDLQVAGESDLSRKSHFWRKDAGVKFNDSFAVKQRCLS